MTPNIFTTYFAAQLSGHPPKWQPVNTLSVQFESGEIVGLTYYSKHFELSPDIEIKGVARVAYDKATNTIYYYAPGQVIEAPADWIDPADWRPAHPDKKRGQPES